jgi:photosystem II stability/assembly factor-like uncharacterized protein
MKHFYIFLALILLATCSMGQWVSQNSGTTKFLSSVFFTDDSTGYIVGGDYNGHIVLKTNNCGTNWDTLSTGTTARGFGSVHFPTTNTGYAGGAEHLIFKTIDAGTTWAILYAPYESIFAIHFTDANTGYVAGGGDMAESGIAQTTDGGITWEPNSLGNQWLNCIYFPNANIGYSVGTNAQMYHYGTINKTSNGGLTWVTIFQLVYVPLNSIYFIDSDTGYVVGDFGTALKTTDGGINWTNLTSGTTTSLKSVYFTDVNTGYVTGENGIILKTNNGGLTWENQISGTVNYLSSVYFTDPNKGFVVGDNGTILKTTNGGQVGLNENGISSKSIKLYPNPAKEKITIESLMTGDTRLSILNLEGKVIMERQITNYQTQIDVSNLYAGVYIVKLKNKYIVEVRKLIKE